MENRFQIRMLFFIGTVLAVASCDSQQKHYGSPPGYVFSKPRRYAMPDELQEISGIAFYRGNSDTLYAEQDEEGKVFHFKLGDDRLRRTHFGRKGDFEDIAICRDRVIMLRSDGSLFTFPFLETRQAQAENVKIWDRLLPDGEYEGLAGDEIHGRLYVLCKHCSDEKTSKQGGGFIFQIDDAGNLIPAGNFEIDVKEIERLTGERKINFHPSALALNQQTGEWFVLSSVNRLLVVADGSWKIKNVYSLDPALFAQPEGIAFDNRQNLYISNERSQTPAGTVLVFAHQ